MQDMDLFLKYNMVPTQGLRKDSSLTLKLRNSEIRWSIGDMKAKILLLHASYMCNSNCIYCENHKLRSEYQGKIMSEDMVREIVEKLGTNLNEVTWHGGEPTIHHNFKDIVLRVKDFCSSHDSRCTIFSNGIRLYDYARLIQENVGCLVNVNHPDLIGSDNWNDLIRSLERIKLCSNLSTVNLGVNMYSTLKDYDFILELAHYFCKDHIRVSYVAPTAEFSGVDKDTYYIEAKELFIPFVEKAIDRGIHIKLDCNHIPRCYFTDDELCRIDPYIEGFHDYCEPVLDITPDFKVTACFGAYELFDIDKFDNIQEIERFLRYKKLYPLSEMNCSGRCATCRKHENLSCQGGCLAFSNK